MATALTQSSGCLQEIFENILNRSITWPGDAEDMSPGCTDLIDRLLAVDPCFRLGHRGAGEIKLHPWFRGLDWATLSRQKAAFIPALNNAYDTSYFLAKPVRSPGPLSVLIWASMASSSAFMMLHRMSFRKARNVGVLTGVAVTSSHQIYAYAFMMVTGRPCFCSFV